MSNWTHVAGIIRIDAIRGLFDTTEISDFDELIGKECRYDSDNTIWDELSEHPDKFLPSGSEGTLRKHVWVNDDASHIAAYTVSIFGDLRDHDTIDDIISWFRNLCDKLWVRQAVITVNNEWMNETKTFTYDCEEKTEGGKTND